MFYKNKYGFKHPDIYLKLPSGNLLNMFQLRNQSMFSTLVWDKDEHHGLHKVTSNEFLKLVQELTKESTVYHHKYWKNSAI